MQDFGLSNVDLTQTTTTTTKEPTRTVPSQQQQLPVNIFITTPTSKKKTDDFLSSYTDLIMSPNSPYQNQIKAPTFNPMDLMATLSKTTEYS